LEAIVEPSRVVADSYRQVTLTTKDGKTVTGAIVPVDYRLPVMRLAVNPLQPETTVDVPKDEIVSYAEVDISPMPPGLLNTFSREEVLALLAYLQRGDQ
jgi:putative heme-binding domain-containing protein